MVSRFLFHDRSAAAGLARALSAAVVVLVAPHAASAQMVPKIPPAPAPKTPYTPPAPAKPIEAKPAEPEPDVPSLVVREPDGKLRSYDVSVELAALRAVKLPADRQSTVDASLARYRADVELWSLNNLDKVAAAIKARKELESMTSFNQLFAAKEAANALQQENVLERLSRDGAISVALRSKIDQVVREYTDARREEWQKAAGSDVMKIATLVGQQSFAEQTQDALDGLDRLIERSLPTLAEDAAATTLDAAQQAKLQELTTQFAAVAPADAAKARSARIALARGFVMNDLTPQQRKALLDKHAPKVAAPAK